MHPSNRHLFLTTRTALPTQTELEELIVSILKKVSMRIASDPLSAIQVRMATIRRFVFSVL